MKSCYSLDGNTLGGASNNVPSDKSRTSNDEGYQSDSINMENRDSNRPEFGIIVHFRKIKRIYKMLVYQEDGHAVPIS